MALALVEHALVHLVVLLPELSHSVVDTVLEIAGVLLIPLLLGHLVVVSIHQLLETLVVLLADAGFLPVAAALSIIIERAGVVAHVVAVVAHVEHAALALSLPVGEVPDVEVLSVIERTLPMEHVVLKLSLIGDVGAHELALALALAVDDGTVVFAGGWLGFFDLLLLVAHCC